MIRAVNDFHIGTNNSGTVRFTVLSGGNVGIGTNNPAHELHLEGNEPTLRHYDTATDKYFDIQVGTGGGVSKYKISSEAASNTLVVGNNARVGINQGAPSYNLDVSANSGNVEARLYRNANVKSSLRFQNSVQHWEIGNSVQTNNQFAIYDHTNSRELLTLSSAGAIFNEGSANVDFRIESNADTHALFLQGSTGNIGIGVSNPTSKLHVNGSFSATSKSFLIDHPTKEGKKLQYGSLEGPENGVYVRGKFQGGKYQDNIIDLPDYWVGLIHEDSITVNLTPVGKFQQLYVEDIRDNQVFIKSADDGEIKCHYTIYGERKDIEKLEVEF